MMVDLMVGDLAARKAVKLVDVKAVK